jgi:hypothetical protein
MLSHPLLASPETQPVATFATRSSRTGVQSPVLLTQTLQALESVSMDCDSVGVPGTMILGLIA